MNCVTIIKKKNQDCLLFEAHHNLQNGKPLSSAYEIKMKNVLDLAEAVCCGEKI